METPPPEEEKKEDTLESSEKAEEPTESKETESADPEVFVEATEGSLEKEPGAENPETDVESTESGDDSLEKMEEEYPDIQALVRMSGDFETLDKKKEFFDALKAYQPEFLKRGKWSVEYDVVKDHLQPKTSLTKAWQREIDETKRRMAEMTDLQGDGSQTLAGQLSGLFFKKKAAQAQMERSNRESRKRNAGKDLADFMESARVTDEVLAELYGMISRAVPDSFPAQISSEISYDEFIIKLEGDFHVMSELKDKYPERDELVDRYKKLSEEKVKTDADRFKRVRK
jgi:hypothetical protein